MNKNITSGKIKRRNFRETFVTRDLEICTKQIDNSWNSNCKKLIKTEQICDKLQKIDTKKSQIIDSSREFLKIKIKIEGKFIKTLLIIK